MKRFVAMAFLTGLVSLLGTGCTTYVFNSPVTLSTRACVSEQFSPVKRVSVVKTNYMFVIIPIMADPRDGYDELLQEAKSAGGNAVVDFQVHMNPSFMWLFPAIFAQDIEYSGLAVRARQ